MKPKPLVALNHFTVPTAMSLSSALPRAVRSCGRPRRKPATAPRAAWFIGGHRNPTTCSEPRGRSTACRRRRVSTFAQAGALGVARPATAFCLVEDRLAQTNLLGSDLDALVLADELESLLEREQARRDQPHQLLGGGGPYVRQLALFGGVHVHVVRARVLPHDHALVDVLTGADEERAALLQVQQRVARRRAASVGHERARGPGAKLAAPRLEPVEDMVQHAGATRLGQELRAEADERPGRHEVLEAHPPGA